MQTWYFPFLKQHLEVGEGGEVSSFKTNTWQLLKFPPWLRASRPCAHFHTRPGINSRIRPEEMLACDKRASADASTLTLAHRR